MATKNTQAILNALQASGGKYFDDHSRGDANGVINLSTADWWGVYREGGREHVFIGYSDSLFCINRTYLDDAGYVHLSVWAVAGNVRMDLYAEIDEAVAAYNEQCKHHLFDPLCRISEFHVNEQKRAA